MAISSTGPIGHLYPIFGQIMQLDWRMACSCLVDTSVLYRTYYATTAKSAYNSTIQSISTKLTPVPDATREECIMTNSINNIRYHPLAGLAVF